MITLKTSSFNQSLPGSSGSTIIQYNDGLLLNSGIEIATNISLVQTEDFSMSLNVNGSKLYNELVEMPTDYFTGEDKILDGNRSAGKSLYDFYMREWAGVNPATGQAMYNLYYDDMNNDGIFNSGDSAINSMTLYMA